MPKLKTHKGSKKVFKVRKGGSIKMGHPGSRHNMGYKSAKANRKKRCNTTLSKADQNRLKNVI